MAKFTRSKDTTETVAQCSAGLDQRCSTCGSVPQSDIDELARKFLKAKLSDIPKTEEELPTKVSAGTEEQKMTGEKGEKLQGKNTKEKHSDGNLKRLSAEKEQPTRQKVKKLLDNWEDTIEGYKKLIAASSSIVATTDDRSLSQCIPNIRKANRLLKNEMERVFAQLEALYASTIDEPNVLDRKVTITDKKSYPIDIEAASNTQMDGEYLITSITALSDGKMAVSGTAPNRSSHITVINSSGKIHDHHLMKGRETTETLRYCCHLFDGKIATVHGTQEIVIFDLINARQLNSSTFSKWKMTCVAYDPKKDKIIVGYGFAKAFSFFDNNLKQVDTLRLDDGQFGYVNDIAVHHDLLLVCHQKGAHAVTIEGLQIKFKFDIPTDRQCATSVCIDKNSFIYMLWSSGRNYLLVQYSEDGKQIHNKILDNIKNGCLTTLYVASTERLVIAANDANNSVNLYSFQLKAEERFPQ